MNREMGKRRCCVCRGWGRLTVHRGRCRVYLSAETLAEPAGGCSAAAHPLSLRPRPLLVVMAEVDVTRYRGNGQMCSLRVRACSHLAEGFISLHPAPSSPKPHGPLTHNALLPPKRGSIPFSPLLSSSFALFCFQSGLPFLIESAVSKQLLSVAPVQTSKSMSSISVDVSIFLAVLALTPFFRSLLLAPSLCCGALLRFMTAASVHLPVLRVHRLPVPPSPCSKSARPYV